MMTSVNILDFFEHQPLTSSLILFAYQTGWFPMADDEDGDIYWHSPERRAIIPLENTYLRNSLTKSFAKSECSFTINTNFQHVIEQCSNRTTTWINSDIISVYCELHQRGFAHSVEVWKNNEIVGGLYGVSIGAAFFGESMFSHISNASKHAFVYLYTHLLSKNFLLLDSQYINDHTQSLGAITVSRKEYLEMLSNAVHRSDINFMQDL
ncbi:MAG: leucyl/phenylalanyl-tRNA--protein transferase [Ignavibacteria bacterium]|jgi:leucyl/phenylalanyl-tRNA--protein transferase